MSVEAVDNNLQVIEENVKISEPKPQPSKRQNRVRVSCEKPELYRPVVAAANRLLQKKWDNMRRQKHEAHLSTVKPMIDYSPPREVYLFKFRLRLFSTLQIFCMPA